jgi:regulator of sigma D
MAGGNGATVQERRYGSKDLISKLTEERAEVLVLYCRLAGVEPYYDKPSRQTMQPMLQQMCQILVDYLAIGHFSLYERIINGNERRKHVRELANNLYPSIAKTTEVALDFNDKYDCEDHCEITSDFDTDLSRLGEALATRIEMEDQLIQAMY